MRVLTYLCVVAVALFAIILLLDATYTDRPIATKATISNTEVQHGESLVVSVEAKNRSFRRFIVVPGYHRFPGPDSDMAGVGFFFKPNGSDYHPLFNYSGTLLEPQWEKLEPRESRRYKFYWRPGKSDSGDGALFLTLPNEFEPIAPFPVRIIKSSEVGASDGEKSPN